MPYVKTALDLITFSNWKVLSSVVQEVITLTSILNHPAYMYILAVNLTFFWFCFLIGYMYFEPDFFFFFG